MAKLHFRYAAMNAGKSTALLQAAYNYEERGLRPYLMVPEVADLFGVGVIASRLGPRRIAKAFDSKYHFGDLSPEGIDCLLIDEAHFLTAEQVIALHRLARLRDLPVICYGLRSDFRGMPFAGAASLLCLADDIEEIRTICSCGSKATMNIRIHMDGTRARKGAQVLVGGTELYRSVCGTCFYADDDQ
jgi:thymidine kinase